MTEAPAPVVGAGADPMGSWAPRPYIGSTGSSMGPSGSGSAVG